MNVTTMVTTVPGAPDREHSFVIAAHDLYPAMIKEILDIIKEGGEEARARVRGDRLDKTPIFSQYLPRALRAPSMAWEMALEAPSADMTEEGLAMRAEALEIARLWFTELLHCSVHNEPMAFQITSTPDKKYRLAL